MSTVCATTAEGVNVKRRRGLVGFQRSRTPPERQIHHQFETRFEETGGVRVGWSNSSAPFAHLTLDGRWCRITNVGFSVPVIWISRDEVWQVRSVRSRLFSPGIMFDADKDQFAGVVFWTFRPDYVLAMFREARWPVEPLFLMVRRPPR